MHTDDSSLTGTVIAAAYRVLNTLGVGFLEKVYENALALELREQGLLVQQQHGVTVEYHGATVGRYFADLLVQGELLVELKTARAVEDAHMAQCINYLKASGLKLCLLLNFGSPRLGIKRIVY